MKALLLGVDGTVTPLLIQPTEANLAIRRAVGGDFTTVSYTYNGEKLVGYAPDLVTGPDQYNWLASGVFGVLIVGPVVVTGVAPNGEVAPVSEALERYIGKVRRGEMIV